MNAVIRRTLVGLVALAVVASVSVKGQQQPQARAVSAAGATLGPWATQVNDMLRSGSLRLARVQNDTMLGGRRHERLAQQHLGVPVFGAELVRQMAGGQPVSILGRIYDEISLQNVQPALGPAAAAGLAEYAAGPGASAGAPQLGILPTESGFVLVWRITVRSPWDIREYDINAETGLVEQSLTRIRSQTPVVSRGTGVLGDPKKVSGSRLGSTVRAIDLLRAPASGITFNFAGSLTRLNSYLSNGSLQPSDIASSPTLTWGDPAVVDAHVHQGWVYDYYFKRHGRRSIDDQDLEIFTIAHPLSRSLVFSLPDDLVDTYINNALYLGNGILMFGDGDGFLFGFFAGAFDVVAHEITHGVSEFTSQFIYQDESGALDEAFADIMGIGAEFMQIRAGAGPQKGPNFQVGEDVMRVSPGFIRSAQNPISGGDPDHYSLRQFIGTAIDNGGVHVNATIVTHAFFLAVNGGTNRVSGIAVTGVGIANISRMERIFYRGLTTLPPSARFSDARVSTLQAATDLFGAGSSERAQLLQAWNAVGVP